LDVEEFELSNFHFQLNDINGKILKSEKIVDNQTKIVMWNLDPAIYFVQVTESNQQIRTFSLSLCSFRRSVVIFLLKNLPLHKVFASNYLFIHLKHKI